MKLTSMKPLATLLAILVLITGGALFAQRAEDWAPGTTFPALSPAEAIKTIEVPKGFKLV